MELEETINISSQLISCDRRRSSPTSKILLIQMYNFSKATSDDQQVAQPLDLLRLTKAIYMFLSSSMSLKSVLLMKFVFLTSPNLFIGISTLNLQKFPQISYFNPAIVGNTFSFFFLSKITVLPVNRFRLCSLQQLSLLSCFTPVSPMKLSSSYNDFSCGQQPFCSTFAQSSVSWFWESCSCYRQGKSMRTRETMSLLVIKLFRRLSTFKVLHLTAYKQANPLLPKLLKFKFNFSNFFQVAKASGEIESASSPLSLRDSSLNQQKFPIAKAYIPFFRMLLLLRLKNKTLSQLALQNSSISSSPTLQSSNCTNSTLLLVLNNFAISLKAFISMTQSYESRQWYLSSLQMMQFFEAKVVNFSATSPYLCTLRMQARVFSIA